MSEPRVRVREAAFAVGDSRTYALSPEQVASILGLHVAEREKLDGRFAPVLEVLFDRSNSVTVVNVILRRTA